MSAERENRSGLFLLETYLAPGLVCVEESVPADGTGPKKRLALSPRLKEHPELLKLLKEDLRSIGRFIRSLDADGSLKTPVTVSGTAVFGTRESTDGTSLVTAFKTGDLRLFRDERNLPRIEASEAFLAAVSDADGLISAFIRLADAFGPRDVGILRHPPGKDEDTLFRLTDSETTRFSRDEAENGADGSGRKYDSENAEFHFTFREPVPQRSFREDTVRENAEVSLRRMTELLTEMDKTRKETEDQA